ncbi:MAG: hypothetical protein WA624_19755 [Methylocella sp.]
MDFQGHPPRLFRSRDPPPHPPDPPPEMDEAAAHVADLMRYAPDLLGDERADAERVW